MTSRKRSASDIAYKPFGPLAALDYGNGQALDLAYNLDYRLSDLDTTDGFTPVQDLAYGHDPAGNITAIADNLDITRHQGFLYDELHRLKQATGLYGQIDYGYDATGNRESRTVTNGSTLTETYFNDLLSNRLESLDRSDLTSRSFAYNERGDNLRDTRPDGAVFDLAYDAGGRLAAAAQNGAARANYRFNARGERVAKVAGGRRAHSLYDTSGQLLAEYDAGAASATLVPPAPETTLDNTDPGASASGSWASATEIPGHLGADYAVAEDGTSSDVFTWTPTVPSAGQYQVFARWPADGNRGTTATYTVTHQAGSTPVTVDQRRSGGQWVPLGSFELAPGAGHKVELSGDAEALGGPAEIVIDNEDPEASTQGTWPLDAWPDGGIQWNGNIAYHLAGSGANRFAWTPDLPEAGRWKVYARWSAHANRASNAPFTVHHAGGATTLRVNQELNGGEWVLLGAFDLAPGEGHRVELTDDADQTVIADAVKFLRDAAAVPAEEILLDNSAATLVGTWTATDYTADGAFWDSDWIYHAAGTGTASATWTPAFGAAGTYRVYARWTQRANRASNAPYTVHHAGGSTTVRVDQELNGGEWVLLGAFDLGIPGTVYRSNGCKGDALRLAESRRKSWIVISCIDAEISILSLEFAKLTSLGRNG